MVKAAGERGEASTIQVVQKVAQIMDCFSADKSRMRASDLRRATGLPMTTVARIVQTLVAGNLLQRQGDHYSVGLRVMAWAAAANSGSDLLATAGPLATALRDETGESCGVYVRQGSSRVSVLQVESQQSIIYRGSVGNVMPLSVGAAGKVLMAFDEDALKAAIEGGLTAHTSYSIVDIDVLREELDQVRRQGWAFSEEERERGLNSLAAPIYGPAGEIVATIAIGGPSFRLTSRDAKSLAIFVMSCAAEISRGLLWRGEAKALPST
jgi:DNA-binding IclR family transcriptional regulator